MNATVTDSGTLRKQLTVRISSADLAKRRSALLQKYSTQVRLDGFRPGKSSKALVEKRFGKVADEQSRDELAEESFKQALTENHLKPLGPVQSERNAGEDGLTLVCSFDVSPAITLPDPSTLTVTKEEATVSDAEVAQALEDLRMRAGTMGALGADETVAKDDYVTLTGTVSVAGTEVRKLHDFHHQVGAYALLGLKPEDVIALFQGKTVGSELRFTSTLPPTFTPAKAANQQAESVVTIQGAQRQRPATADDAFAVRLGTPSLAELTQVLRKSLLERKQAELHQQRISQLTEALLALPVELPPTFLATVTEERASPVVTKAEQEGKDAAAIATLREQASTDAQRSLKRFMILDRLADELAVQVTNADIENQIQLAATQHRRPPLEILQQLKKSGQIPRVMLELREAKTLETLLERVLGGAAPAASGPEHGQPGHVHGPACSHQAG